MIKNETGKREEWITHLVAYVVENRSDNPLLFEEKLYPGSTSDRYVEV